MNPKEIGQESTNVLNSLEKAEGTMREIKNSLPNGSLSSAMANKILLDIKNIKKHMEDFINSKSIKNLKLTAKYHVIYKNH